MSLRSFFVSFLALLGIGTALALAQTRRGDATPLGNDSDETNYTAAIRSQFIALIRGDRQPTAEDRKVFDVAARFYVYRITWPYTTDPNMMPKIRGRFRQDLEIAGDAVRDKKDNRQALRQAGIHLSAKFKELFDKLPFDKNRSACVNAALMLPILARLKQPETADLLVSLLEDPKQHDAVKLGAAQALAEFFPAREFVFTDSGKKNEAEQKKIDLKRVNALLKLITRPFDSTKYVTQEQTEAFRWVRREAIKSLGEARVPAIEVEGKTGKIEAPVARVLLAFLAPEPKVTPEPTLAEKIEAAIAVCRFKVDPNSGYLPAEGIYRVGTFLAELETAYKADFNRFAVSKTNKEYIPSVLPWRFHARRLETALNDMVDSVKFNPSVLHQKAAANAIKVQKEAQPLLKAMSAQPYQTDLFSAGAIAAAVAALQPQSPQIYKGETPAKGE